MSDIEATLAERGKRYGEFGDFASLAQALKRAMHNDDAWELLPDDVCEALDMIQHKIARIISGDPAYIDSWHDIIGYARLVEKRLESEQADEEAARQVWTRQV